MTLDDAIQHAKEVAVTQRNNQYCIKCAEEHEQLAEWLEKLKEYQQLEEQPTVYDVDKVVAELQSKSFERYGNQGMRAAEKELKTRGALFIPLEVNQEQLDESVCKIKLNTIDTILIMSCMVLRDEFDFGQKRLDRFCERFNSKTAAICDGDIIWDDLIQTLKEETGLDFTIRENK